MDNLCGQLFYKARDKNYMNGMEKTQKIRFKFANGEEFEAEGTLDFVEKQRDYFLTLIKKKPLIAPASAPLPPATPLTTSAPRAISHEDKAVSGTLTPRMYATAPGSYAYEPQKPAPSAPFPAANADANAAFSGARLWEQLLTREGDNLYLRRKFHLSADDAALILLAGGKELLGKDGCSALWLARALAKSGFSAGRLDRLLAAPLKLNFLLCQGAKRSRLYMLTPAGFTHAFVVAEKKSQALL